MSISLISNGYSSTLNSINSTSDTSQTSSNSDLSTILNELQSSASSSVTLNGSTTNPATKTYTAQGLLQQINADKLSNDKLLLGGDSSTDSSNSSDLSALTSQLNGSNSQTDSTQTNTDWASALKTNPSMAPVLVQDQINQSLMSIFNSKA